MRLEDPQDEALLSAIAYTRVEDLLLLYHTTAAPPNQEWDAWIAYCVRLQCRAVLVFTEGGAPTSSQRARLASAMSEVDSPPRVALMTDSAVVRSVMTAFIWLLGTSQPLKAFSSAQLDDAIAWLGVGVTPGHVGSVIARLQRLLREAKRTAR